LDAREWILSSRFLRAQKRKFRDSIFQMKRRRLCAALDLHSNTRAADVIRLQVLTGARLGEVLTSRKEDFDLHRGIWTKPSHHTTQKRTEHLPLSAQALILVTLIIETSDTGSSFLFPGNKPGQPLRNDQALRSSRGRSSPCRRRQVWIEDWPVSTDDNRT
jgi:integrase